MSNHQDPHTDELDDVFLIDEIATTPEQRQRSRNEALRNWAGQDIGRIDRVDTADYHGWHMWEWVPDEGGSDNSEGEGGSDDGGGEVTGDPVS